MTGRERRLLAFLGAAVFLAACSLAAASGAARLRQASLSLDRYRSRLASVQSQAAARGPAQEARVQRLKAEVARLEESARGAGEEMDPAAFGMDVRRALAAAGAVVLRYQDTGISAREGRTGAPDDTESLPSHDFEFTARGSPLALSRFLLFAGERGWEVPFLSVRSESERAVEFVVRIGYGR